MEPLSLALIYIIIGIVLLLSTLTISDKYLKRFSARALAVMFFTFLIITAGVGTVAEMIIMFAFALIAVTFYMLSWVLETIDEEE